MFRGVMHFDATDEVAEIGCAGRTAMAEEEALTAEEAVDLEPAWCFTIAARGAK